MHPLSVLKYYFRNKLRLAPMFAVLALAVFGISLTGVLTGSIKDTMQQHIEVYRGAIQVLPSPQSKSHSVDAVTLGDLRRDPNVEAIYPTIRMSTYRPGIAGASGSNVFAVNTEVLPVMLEHFELTLVAERLPRTGTNQLALHQEVLKARGLKLGALLDPEQDDLERLPIKFQVVGVLNGPTVLSLASLEYVSQRTEFTYRTHSVLVFPCPGAQAALEADLRELNPDRAQAFIYPDQLAMFQQDFSSMDSIVWAINSVVVIVLSLLAGLLNVIYFMDRMNEFGLLLGIGYPKAFVVRRALVESLVLTVAAWTFGILFSQLMYTVLNRFVFEPRGLALSVLNWRALQFTLPIPIMVGLFAAGTVIWQLRGFDPISIIERRD